MTDGDGTTAAGGGSSGGTGEGSAGSAASPNADDAADPPADDAAAGETQEPEADDASSDEPGSDSTAGEVCARDARAGSFRVYLGEDRTIFAGAVSDGIAPAAIPQVIASEGSCELLAPRDLFCSDGCGPGETCSGEDICVPSPEKVSAGTVNVSGLLAPVEVDPNPITGDYSKTIMDPFPGFEPGAAIELSAAGDVVSAFSMSAFGVAAMTTPSDTLSVASGSAVSMEWDASSADPSESGVYITFTVNAHGSVTGWIECTAPDSGSFEIPEPLVTELIELGLSGFPRATLGRRSTATVDVAQGCVDLSVSSEVTLELEVDGLISCTSDEDCPDGQTCSEELACGEGN